jgi:hypothetical protein
MADVGFRSPIRRNFGHPTAFVLATSVRSNTSSPASKVRESPGADLVTVSALLGHQRLETTAIYTTPRQRDLEQAVARLEQEDRNR